MIATMFPSPVRPRPSPHAFRPAFADAGLDDAVVVSATRPMMGGAVGVHLYPAAAAGVAGSARQDAERLLGRMEAWAARLTRYSPTSDLVRLNASPWRRVPVRPTLAEVLDWGREAQGLSDGIVDIALLDARLAAEGIDPRPTAPARPGAAARSWSMDRRARGSEIRRPVGLTFDLNGVAKGWLADRALLRLKTYPSAIIDADGDVAIRLERGRHVRFAVADPRAPGERLAELELRGPEIRDVHGFGLATSGTTVHHWKVDGRPSHHLIDPRTGRPSCTDVVQATVLSNSAREAEAIAKSAVILGSEATLGRLDRSDVHGAILLTERGDVLVTPSTVRWLV